MSLNKVYKNAAYLSFINIINYLIPIFIIPILIDKLGMEIYGKYVLFQAIIGGLLLVANFGFDFSATKKISLSKSINEISDIYNAIFIVKFTICSLLLLFVLLSFFLISKNDFYILILFFPYVVFSALVPAWLYQGKEEMGVLVFFTFIQKIGFLILVLLLLESKSDFMCLAVSHSVSTFFLFLFSNFYSIRKFKIKISSPNSMFVFSIFKDSKDLFISNLFISFYREFNTIILALYFNYSIIAAYSVVEKIVKGIQGVISPFSRAIFPHYSSKINSWYGFISYRNIGLKYAFLLLFLSILFFIFRDFILLQFISDPKDIELASNFYELMIWVVFFGGLNYYLGFVGLVNLGYEKFFRTSVIGMSVISVAAIFVFSSLDFIYAGAISFLVSEVFLFLLLFIKVIKVDKCNNS